MAKLSKDITPGNLHPREILIASGVIATNGGSVEIPCDGCAQVSFDVRSAALNMILVLEGTTDGVNYTTIAYRPLNPSGAISYQNQILSATGAFVASCVGYTKVRVRCSSYTSGAATVTIAATNAPMDQGMYGVQVTSGIGTATGLASAAVTLTLNSPGAGLRHYITSLTIIGFAAAALTAAATPVVVTSTNLPGSLAWSVDAEARAQGASWRLREEYSAPIAASAQATATTIVCPATTNVIWRVTVGYYVAP